MINGHKLSAKAVQKDQDFTIFHEGAVHHLYHYLPGAEDDDGVGGSGVIVTPMPGKVTRLMVAEGDEVKEGQPLMILEAMKMEHTIKADIDGSVSQMSLSEGDQVADGHVLIRIEGAEE